MELPADHPLPQVDSGQDKPWGGVLAGGAGQRLGGIDKGWLMLHGRPLVLHVLKAMQDHCAQVVINANRHLADYAALRHAVVPDLEPFAGPLGGMVSLFAAYPRRLWLMAPCDMPGWPDDLVPALLARYRQGGHDVVIAGCDGRPMPVLGLYGPRSQAHLLGTFWAGERSPCRALDGLRWDVLWLPHGRLVNINTPKALQAAAAPRDHTCMIQHPTDRLGRPLTDLRLSLTDRCNLRCTYCMPQERFGAGYRFLPRRELLTFEEITRVAGAAARLGVTKLRLTGGEPLLRRGVAELVAMLGAIPGISDLAMTTNGTLLSRECALALRRAGLKRLTISLDALDAPTVAAMSGSAMCPEQVLRGIDHALEAGFAPLKVNMVVQAGINEHAIIPMAAHFRHKPVVLRFIEYMDVGGPKDWQHAQVIEAAQIHQRLDARWPLEPFDTTPSKNVAREYRYRDGGGTIGLIAAVSQPFCRSCSRLRLSAQGMVHGCLFAPGGLDLRCALREDGVDDERLMALLCGLWQRREDRYSELRQSRQGTARPLMGQLGG